MFTLIFFFFFFNDTATTEIYTLSLHDALPIFMLLPTLGAAAVWVVAFLATRYTSVASMLAALALPVFALLLEEPTSVVLFAAGAAVAILVLHRANIGRLAHGKENRFELRSRRAAPQRSGPVG